jgi:hypothetical protein
MVPENMDEAFLSRSRFLLEELNERIIRALQEHAADGHFPINASFLEGVYDGFYKTCGDPWYRAMVSQL